MKTPGFLIKWVSMTTKNECTTKELSELNLLRINTIKQYYIIIEQKKSKKC